VELFAAIVAALPIWARVALGGLVAWLAGSVFRIRRAHVEAAMSRAGVARPAKEARAMYRALGAGAVELLTLSRDASALSTVVVDPASQGRWSAAIRARRGIVIAASHTGNWDLAACAIARDVDLVVITKHLRARAIDAFWQRTRSARGVHLVDAEGALAVARAAIARGAAVAILIDQVPVSRRHAIEVEFLGATAFVDRTAATLAATTGAPLLVTAAERTPTGHLLHVLDALEPPRRGRSAWIDAATRDATKALERFVLAHPRDWLWLHRRWRAPADIRPRPTIMAPR
jgi:KDO2-lipid IV(A) lauroyltransferase